MWCDRPSTVRLGLFLRYSMLHTPTRNINADKNKIEKTLGPASRHPVYKKCIKKIYDNFTYCIPSVELSSNRLDTPCVRNILYNIIKSNIIQSVPELFDKCDPILNINLLNRSETLYMYIHIKTCVSTVGSKISCN